MSRITALAAAIEWQTRVLGLVALLLVALIVLIFWMWAHDNSVEKEISEAYQRGLERGYELAENGQPLPSRKLELV